MMLWEGLMAHYHASPVDLYIVDLDVLKKAPVRTLKAVIVDSLAKLPELRSGENPTASKPLMVRTAVAMASYIIRFLENDVSCVAQGDTDRLEEIADTVIAVTGTYSGYTAAKTERANGFLIWRENVISLRVLTAIIE